MKPGQEHRPRLGDAVSVAVAKKNDPVLARYRSSGFRLKVPEEKALDPRTVGGALRCVRFRDEHVTVGEDVDPPRVVQASRVSVDTQAVRGLWHRIVCPTFCFDHVYDG